MVRCKHSILLPFVVLVLGLVSSVGFAQQNGDVLILNSNFYDETSVLNKTDKGYLQKILNDFEADAGGPLAVVILKNIKSNSIEEYCKKVYQINKLGTGKKDEGLLLLISLDKTKLWVHVGEGWQGKITQKKLSKIIWNMMPYFRLGQFKDGLIYFIYSIQKVITGNAPTTPKLQVRESLISYFITGSTLVILIFIISFIFRMFSNKGQTFTSSHRKRLERLYSIKSQQTKLTMDLYKKEEINLLQEKHRFGGEGASGKW